MRKYILLLIFICSLNIYAAGLPPAPQPEALQAAIRAFVDTRVDKKMPMNKTVYGWPGTSSYSEVLSIPFCCDANDNVLLAIIDAFFIDEKNCYQYVHELPGSGMLYSVSLDSRSSRREITRKSKDHEFYMLCAKNYDNPRYRDMYTISYAKKKKGGKKVYEGVLFHIYSPRPDYKEDEVTETPQYQKFILVGQFDKEMMDSCRYVGLRGVNSKGGLEYGSRRETVVDGRFVFTKQLGKAMDIQISYDYKSGRKSDWLTIRANPGATIYATFHKDSYEIERVETDYDDGAEPKPEHADDENSATVGTIMAKTEEALKGYSIMLKSINEQIRELRSVSEDAPDYADVKKRLSGLHKSAKDITNKMQELVDKVTKELEQ